MSFTRKIIQITVSLNTGNFTGTSSNTITLQGYRTSFAMHQSGGLVSDVVNIVVYGLDPSLMNQLSTYGNYPSQINQNQVSVSAGDNESGLALVFQGTITTANADYSTPKENKFVMQAYTSLYPAIAPAAASSYAGTADVAVIMGNLAKQANLTLENSGVTTKLSNPVFPGSVIDQMKACARAANINAYIDSKLQRLAIWPANKARGSGQVIISPSTGLVGYPAFSQGSMTFKTLFNPNIVFGQNLTLQSSLQAACGQWSPFSIATELDAETEGGNWFQTIMCVVYK